MDQMEEKLGAILGNPDLMQQIMSMAQSFGQSAPQLQTKEEPEPVMPEIDPVLIGKIASMAGKTNIDRNQKALLRALEPYLTAERIRKLEKAMRASKLAGAASSLLQNGSIPFLSGR